MVEARLSDHRPVIARFIVDVEEVSRRKLSKACILSNDAKVKANELLPSALPVSKINNLHNLKVFGYEVPIFCRLTKFNSVCLQMFATVVLDTLNSDAHKLILWEAHR